MNKLRIIIICTVIGATIAAPFVRKPERQLREIDIEPEANTGLVKRDEQNHNYPHEIILEIISETTDAAQTKDVLVIDEILGKEEVFNNDDMEVAETHIFRPLFRYRAQLERRQRVKKNELIL